MSSRSRPSRVLIADTVRSHRRGAVVWIVGGALAMYGMSLGIAAEMARFTGGAKAMAASMQASVEALRLMRWPAERLDTLGGYLTYHNVILFVLLLSVYAAVQGSHAVRGLERAGVLEEILATGRSRPAVIRDRAIGFALTLTLICVGLGIALAASMATGGEPDLGGSFITALATGLAALAAYALGVLASQLLPTPRSGTATAAGLVTGLYLLTNVWEQIGPVGAIRFVSPFYYFNFSRALVPGYSLDIAASLILIAMTTGLLAASAWAFQRRDYAAGLWARRQRPAKPVRRVQRPALTSIWAATLLRQRLGLLAWAGAAAVTLGLMGWLEPDVMEIWDEFGLTQVMGGDPSRSATDLYLSFSAQLVVPIMTAYVIVQAAGWVNDLEQGRVELVLASPVSWPQLIAERLLATMVGALIVTAAAIGGLIAAATAVGAEVDAAGLVRLTADTTLLTAAMAGVALLVVAWLRSTAAVSALAILLAASYLLVYLTPLFDWPGWVLRASVFGAFGDPYLERPAVAGLAVLAALTVVGGVAGAVIAQRSPKVA